SARLNGLGDLVGLRHKVTATGHIVQKSTTGIIDTGHDGARDSYVAITDGNGLGGGRIDRRVGDRKLSLAGQFLSEQRSQAAKRQNYSGRERDATIHVFLPSFRWKQQLFVRRLSWLRW